MQVPYVRSESGHLVVVALFGNALAIKVGEHVFLVDNPALPKTVGEHPTVDYQQGDTADTLLAKIEEQATTEIPY